MSDQLAVSLLLKLIDGITAPAKVVASSVSNVASAITKLTQPAAAATAALGDMAQATAADTQASERFNGVIRDQARAIIQDSEAIEHLNNTIVDSENLERRANTTREDTIGKLARAREALDKYRAKYDAAMQSAANLSLAAQGVGRFAEDVKGAVAQPMKVAEDFEAAMGRVRSVADASDAQFAAMNAAAVKLSSTSVFSATEVAGGMFELAKAGFNAKQVMDAIPGTMALAAASGTELSRSTEIASDILRGFRLEATQTGRVADVLAAAAIKSSVDLSDLGETMKYVAPLASTLGLSLEQVSAMAGVLGNAGIKGSMAGTALRSALGDLVNPRGRQAGALAALGITTVDAKNQARPLMDILDELQAKTATMGEAGRAKLVNTIFGERGMPAMLQLMKAGGKEVDAFRESIKGQGAAAATAAKMLDNAAGAQRRLNAANEALDIKLGNSLLPGLKKYRDTMADVKRGIAEFADKHDTATGVVMGTGGALGAVATALERVLFFLAAIKVVGGFGWLAAGYTQFAAAASGISLSAATAGLGAFGAALVGVGLAYHELKKHWPSMNFGEMSKGIAESGLSGLGLLGSLLNPAYLARDLGIHTPEWTMMGSDPGEKAFDPLEAKRQQQNVGGTIKVEIDNQGRGAVTQLAATGGIALEADIGLWTD